MNLQDGGTGKSEFLECLTSFSTPDDIKNISNQVVDIANLGGPPPSDFEFREIYPRVEDNGYPLQLLSVFTRLFCVPSF